MFAFIRFPDQLLFFVKFVRYLYVERLSARTFLSNLPLTSIHLHTNYVCLCIELAENVIKG